MSLEEKVKTSIERIQRFADIADTYSPDGKAGYYLAFSGGKDSIVTKRLLDMAGVKYDAHYRVTSVDPPELVLFIKEYHPDVEREIPRDDDGQPITMWNLIPARRMPPTRIVRYCCEALKETGGGDRFGITGVRWAESSNRKQNQGIITIPKKNKNTANLLKHENFMKTIRGGGAQQRQRRGKGTNRGMPYAEQDDTQPDYRLDGRRRLGIYPAGKHSVLRAIR